ncbi:iron ABC transporter [Bacteroidetes bacterium UKL13-3]|jgi:ABC-type Fe3+-hydroxamate transport system substrate-binding protein|nr:iron ABC transporter [Bacteroidetes bacterium UKL13-3]HCP92557.1 cobalamin-binding protein [Bacteroidota bacterium]
MKRLFTDQMNRSVEVAWPPKRIVSLVPSQTELLYDLGLHNEVVGQTLFCIHPPEMHELKPRIGGTKNVNIETVAALQPDLIIGNKEENDRQTIEALAKLYPVWMSNIQTLEDALEMINLIGELVNRPTEAQLIASTIQQSFSTLLANSQQPTVKSVYLIWRKPWMAAGHDTFINDMLNRLGFHNVAQSLDSRYPEITDQQIQSFQPDVIFLSSEPYPFKAKHIEELQAICPQATIKLVDGELFSWYGSRLVHSVAYFKELLISIC